jgi:hypothetical protein
MTVLSTALRIKRLRREVAMMSVAVICIATGELPAAPQRTSSEYQVKAAFLFHFAQFVDWPADAFKDGESPLIYCTIGEDPFRGALDQSLSGKTVGARPLRVEHLNLKQPEEAQSCQVLFIGTGEKSQKEAVETAVQGHAVLTVGDGEHFARDGGMIGFCLEDNRVRFEINLDAAEKANLRISAKLLALAKAVIGKPRGS